MLRRRPFKDSRGSTIIPFLMLIPSLIIFSVILIDLVGMFVTLDKLYNTATLSAFSGVQQVDESLKQSENILVLDHPLAYQAAASTAAQNLSGVNGSTSYSITFSSPTDAGAVADPYGATIEDQINVTIRDDYTPMIDPFGSALMIPFSVTQSAVPQEAHS